MSACMMLSQRSGSALASRKQSACGQQRSLALCRAGGVEPSSSKPLFQLDDRQSLNMEDIM